ncbi:CHASE2 domain-containing protein [Polynucleobacter arcticus]|uniref:CHASE2 domain-containing protein n=1 Tax=Polynucleobacter arcticus TaxID=1743165 RepID=UPI0039EED34A
MVGFITVVILFVFSLFDGLGVHDSTKRRSLDALVKIFPYDKYYPDNAQSLVFVAIDDVSLEKLGQWPWPRQTIAKITENISKSGAAASGLDILFIEEDRYTPKKISSLLNIPEPRLLSAGAVNGDAELAQSLSQTSTAVAFALSGEASINPKTLFPNRFIVIGDVINGLLEVPNLIMPLPVFSVANGAGFVNTHQVDGFIRETPLIAAHKGDIFPALGLEMLRLAVGAKNYIVKPSDSGHQLMLKVGDAILNLNSAGSMLLHHGHTSRFSKISAHRLVNGIVLELEGKIAVVGVDALALGDRHSTPLEDSIPGALIHLQIIDQLLAGRFISTNNIFDRVIFLICAILSLISVLLVQRLSLVYAIGLLISSAAVLTAIALYVFLEYGFLFNFPLGLVLLFSGGLVTYLLKSLFEESLRKRMQKSFLQYVPADVVKRITQSSNLPTLGGELIDTTVLFLDLRGFTSLTERLKDDPVLMVKTISTIMDEVTIRLIESGATIDKYIGDAVMAFWNAPEKQENHQARALYAACLIEQDANIIREKMYALDDRLRGIHIDFGIGVASGGVTVGNMGSSFRFNYTVLGDAVNMAARLETMTKDKVTSILVAGVDGSREYEFNGRAIQLISMGAVEIRGKRQSIEIFEAQFSDKPLATPPFNTTH